MLPLLLTASLLGACQRTPDPFGPPVAVSDNYQILQGQSGPGLVADPGSPIPDVPKPIGFKADAERSSSAGGGGGPRQVHHVYQGVGSIGEAVAFYRQALRNRGWEPAGIRSTEQYEAILHYVKGSEALSVKIGGGGRVSTLVIDITPYGGTSDL